MVMTFLKILLAGLLLSVCCGLPHGVFSVLAFGRGGLDGRRALGLLLLGMLLGTPTDLPWAVTFPDVARLRHHGLPEVPLHPTQV